MVSLGLFAREFGQVFAKLSQGLDPAVATLLLQYADFARWQRRVLAERVLGAQLQYWRAQLADAPPLLELPLDYPRPAVQSSAGAALTFDVDASVADRLRMLGLEEGATPFMVLLASYFLLLARFCGSNDIVIGTPVSGRNLPELQSLIGLFVNTLVLRSKIAPMQSFRELLRNVRRDVLAAQANQDLPFEQLVDALRPARSLSHTPLFQVMFMYGRGTTEAPTQWPGMNVTQIKREQKTAKFDLTLSVNESGLAYAGTFEYNTQLFRADTIVGLAEIYARLLRGVSSDPDQAVARYPLLDLAACGRPTRAGMPVGDIAPTCAGVHLAIADAASRTDAIAVVDRQGQLSYAELELRAQRTAAMLQARGVRPGDTVVVLMRRSSALLVALLGVLKAGAAYVPLDPGYPPERVRYILDDCAARLLLT